jgi:hypothetical protein
VATPNLLATCTPYLPGVGKCRVVGGWVLITGKFGDRLLRAVIIYERLASVAAETSAAMVALLSARGRPRLSRLCGPRPIRARSAHGSLMLMIASLITVNGIDSVRIVFTETRDNSQNPASARRKSDPGLGGERCRKRRRASPRRTPPMAHLRLFRVTDSRLAG